MITAARMGNLDAVRYLCNYGADLEVGSDYSGRGIKTYFNLFGV